MTHGHLVDASDTIHAGNGAVDRLEGIALELTFSMAASSDLYSFTAPVRLET
jgi:hypothetical protein